MGSPNSSRNSAASFALTPRFRFKLGLEYFIHQDQGADMTWRDANKTPVIGRLFSDYLEKRLGPGAQGRRTSRAAPL